MEDLRQAIELLFFAYRDFTAEPDAILAAYGFGRAHHRVIYFVGRHPGITVSQLLDILQITKQSLARVLRQLVDEGFIEQRQDLGDGRRRLLHLLEAGQQLEIQLTTRQAMRIAAAYQGAGADGSKNFKDVLRGMINKKDRDRFDEFEP
jgi:DNA-binding MarR family transcriptional regulator